MKALKKNVKKFEEDVTENSGYKYTTNAGFSSVVSNRRMTQATVENWLPGEKRVIDIGCGDGTYTEMIRQPLKNVKMEGMDAAKKAVAMAKKKYKKIRFYAANILKKRSLNKKGYDLAVIRGVLHHVSDPVLAMRNSFYASPRLIVIEPNGNNPLLKVIEKTSKYHREHEEKSFSAAMLKRFCEEAGGKVENLYYIGYVPFFFPELPSRIIYFFQPLLEKIPLVREFLSAQIIMVCTRKGK